MLFRLIASTAVVASALAMPGFPEGSEVHVSGGGSTFAAPIYQAWIDAYRPIAPAVDISYDVIGSGEGISRFLGGSLGFAATDAPLTAEQEATVPGGVNHIPVTAGMVAVPYNLPGDLEGPLRLPRDVLGEIFAGAITNWDDPRLARANPDLHLPHDTIRVVARLDGSGTTYAFTNHLNASSEAWRQTGVGVARSSAGPPVRCAPAATRGLRSISSVLTAPSATSNSGLPPGYVYLGAGAKAAEGSHQG